jgi:nitroreductase
VTTATAAPVRPTVVEPPAAPAALHPLLADRFSPRAFDTAADVSPEQLGLLLEAARWAPSASNTQPARFLVGRRGDDAYDALLGALMPGNQRWARDAAALILVAAETEDAAGSPRGWALYDAGQAAAHLTVQASAIGLAVRQMGGFVAADLPELPEHVTPLAVVAVGVPLAPERIPADHLARRLGPRSRRPLDELLLDVA